MPDLSTVFGNAKNIFSYLIYGNRQDTAILLRYIQCPVLGFSCGNLAVGYYTAAIKLYTIILSVIVAFNSVFVPYLNDIYAKVT